jgi:hypothetical protein
MARSIVSNVCAAIGVVSLAVPAIGATPVEMPAGMTRCDFSAWSQDSTPQGLNVRAGPRANAPVIARLVEQKQATGSFVEFEVIGVSNGWFLIDHASHGDYGDPPPRVPVYAGQGWVSGSLVGGQLLAGKLYDAPSDSARSRLYGKDTDAVQVKRVLDCTGEWVKVEADIGTGWVHGLCSNQATTCV